MDKLAGQAPVEAEHLLLALVEHRRDLLVEAFGEFDTDAVRARLTQRLKDAPDAAGESESA